MALRRAHGKAKALGGPGVRIETLPIHELPDGEPSRALVASRGNHDARGKFARGNALSKKGGQAHKGKCRLAQRLGLTPVSDAAGFAPYRRQASAFRAATCRNLAEDVGGGFCGPIPSSMVASAALQLAWSRYFSDRAAETGDKEDAITSSRLAEASRLSLSNAHEYCAKEAKARKGRGASRTRIADLDGGSR